MSIYTQLTSHVDELSNTNKAITNELLLFLRAHMPIT